MVGAPLLLLPWGIGYGGDSLETYTPYVASPAITDAELDQLAREFKELGDEALARVTYTPEELVELAERHRRLARLSDSEGQRRALISAAERYELEAQNRAAVRP